MLQYRVPCGKTQLHLYYSRMIICSLYYFLFGCEVKNESILAPIVFPFVCVQLSIMMDCTHSQWASLVSIFSGPRSYGLTITPLPALGDYIVRVREREAKRNIFRERNTKRSIYLTRAISTSVIWFGEALKRNAAATLHSWISLTTFLSTRDNPNRQAGATTDEPHRVP